MLQLRGFDESLRIDGAPHGIVGYELAWSAQNAQTFIKSWRDADVAETAKVSLGVDFAFLLAYPLMFSFGIALLAERESTTAFGRLGSRLRYVVLACIPLDAIENIALWRMIDHDASDGLAHLATIAAGIKFLLVIAAALWCLVAIVRRFTDRRTITTS